MEYLGGYFIAFAALCILSFLVNGVLKKQGIKNKSISISNIIFVLFLAIYFFAYALNPIMVPFDPEQVNFEIIGAICFLICLAIVWNNYRISCGVEHCREVHQGT